MLVGVLVQESFSQKNLIEGLEGVVKKTKLLFQLPQLGLFQRGPVFLKRGFEGLKKIGILFH
jgi:hypothetical protein